MNPVQIRLYNLFRKDLSLSDDKAAEFVAAVEEAIAGATKEQRQILATKEDIYRLELKIEQSKGDIYKAMFWTGIVQLLAILGGVLAIVKFIA